MSGLTKDLMRDVYYYFLSIIRNAFESIEERLLPITHNSDDLPLEELALIENYDSLNI
jgi:hypothetical protein